MNTELNTLLVTLYVHLDDRILPAIGFSRDHRPGRKSALSDVELLCLLVAQHLLGIASDRKWIRYARAHLRGMFPNIPKQSGWGKRVRQSTGLISAVITELARDTPTWNDLTPRYGKLGAMRQWVESVFDTLKGQLTLEQHGGRTLPGVYSRVAARLLALAAAIWHNWHTDAPTKRSLIAYDH